MLLFVCLISAVAAIDPITLREGLQSAEGQMRLFNSWMQDEHAHYGSPHEKSLRFRIFRKHLKEIVEINSAQNMYTLDVNFMAGLSDEEQQSYYGINASIPVAPAPELVPLLSAPTADGVDWRQQGKVTPVKNQGSCGSCWTFAGIASFEGHYAVKAGSLKEFAEQEFLDCTYEGQGHNGCNGGWYWEAFDMVGRTQHLSEEKDYPYKARDTACLTSSKPNGMTGVASKGAQRTSGDSNLVTALNLGPVAMAFEIKGGFNYYRNGILSIENCGRTPHHAMAVTGYTADYFDVKNSWGSRWGDNGYVKFDRKINNMCGISNWNAYPLLEASKEE